MTPGGTGAAVASALDFIGPFIVAGLLLYALGRMRRYLYEHIFKVGWLLTKNLRTTTILFYVFFLPGLLVYEFVYWLAAGFLDVRAERAITWPEAQQIAELRLNFVKLAKAAGAFRTAVITIAPFITGTLLIWLVAHDILGVSAFADRLQTDGVSDLGGAIEQLFSAPDFFLWVYILFTIGNTMMPHWSDLRGARIVLIVLGVALVIMLALGVGTDIIRETIVTPLIEAVNLVSTVFAITLGVNLIMTALLGLAESIIERITGDSATYQNGKLVAMTRAEVQVFKREQAEREATARKRQQERQKRAASGPPSIYRMPLPIPGSPGREMRAAPESVSVRRDDSHSLGPGAPGLPAQTMPPAPPPSSLTQPGHPRPQPGPPTPGSPATRPIERQPGQGSEQGDQQTRPQPARPLMPAANRPQPTQMPNRGEGEQSASQPQRPAPYRPTTPTTPQRTTSAPGTFRRPDNDEDDEADEAKAQPQRPAPYRAPTPTTPQRTASALGAFRDDDDEDEDDEADEAKAMPQRPAPYRPPTTTGPQRTASALGAFRDDDDEEEDEDDEADEALGAFRDDDEEEDDEADEAKALPQRPAPYRSPTPLSPQRTSSALDAFLDDDDEDEDDDDLTDEPGRP
ncbi:MAG: hypothetical protein IT320_27360 [Anaerolineae bacterium]|nr:hypothetical protein [Anaerolineae bacterium]